MIGIKLHDRNGSSGDFVEFHLSDVKYIDTWQETGHSAKVPAYHTPYGSFLAVHTLKDIAKAYAKFGFSLYDRSTIVNEKNIKELIPTKSGGTKVIFKDDTHVTVRKNI